ncbi:hypothetical protein CBR_g12441 [Chara braunii]|uniref:ABC transporter domain-containing protein n=1 Tax=Chara braunii TaxID=69332 RepID=A0A388JSB3_CHABU|nr:hypothetical protein CBR_g12441 [Chara braunii]|eukprot:GBG60704.1 hypothetical protein CBR_g12441 [Chara braunii]
MDPERSILQRKAALRSSFTVQANALSRKNLRLQARQWRVNACLVVFPLLLFVLLLALQFLFDNVLLGGDDFKCGCNPQNKSECGVEFSNGAQAGWCAIKNPPANPALLQMPNITTGLPAVPFSTVVPVTAYNRSLADAIGRLLFKAVKPDVLSSASRSFLSIYPVSPNGLTLTLPLNNRSAAASRGSPSLVAGTAMDPDVGVQIIEQAFIGQDAPYTPLFLLSSSCAAAFANGSSATWQLRKANLSGEAFGGNVPFVDSSSELSFRVGCYEANYTYFPPSFDLDFLRRVFPGGDGALKITEGFGSSVEAYLYNRYFLARPSKQEVEGGKEYVPGVVAAYDFKNSSSSGGLNLHVWYNDTYRSSGGGGGQPDRNLRLARSFNLATKAFLSWAKGANDNNNNRNVSESLLSLLYVKEFPKGGTSLQLDVSAFFGPLLFVWVLGLILPIVCNSLVYEKEVRLRSMMKMHGLGDGPYWAISYLYFLTVSIVYMFFFVAMGNVVRVKFFTLNDMSILIVFLLVYFNNLVAFGFLWSAIFSSTKTVTISAYLYVFGSGLLAEYLFRFFLENPSTSRGVVFAFELVPAFALYRGLYEFANYSFVGNYMSTKGMRWSNLSDENNGVGGMIGILVVEWIIFLLLALYLDQIVDTGAGVPRRPLFFLDWCFGGERGKKQDGGGRKEMELPSFMTPTGRGGGGGGSSGGGPVGEDVAAEKQTARAALEGLLGKAGGGSSSGLSIVCDELQKVYKGTDGNPDKFAVQGMSLAVPRGECFGMLGPNGAGKTTSINMMVGFLEPTSGTALIEGMDIRGEMSAIHSVMGVCPQHDLLWETLTGREHLLFYGRLKNLKGEQLEREIEMWLRKMNLYNGGVLAKPVRAYSGGMKRRLSVAISLIGNPLVVYMDEPSTGLDPASRNNLWQVVKEAKRGRAIILTTHSMEEAEVLCDRLGIFIDGQFACIGNPRELTARYGGTYDLTVTTPPGEESAVEALALSLSHRAKKVYSLGGTQKFELPSSEVDLADVFDAIERAKTKINIQAWGIANTTLEDVFIKVAGKK